MLGHYEQISTYVTNHDIFIIISQILFCNKVPNE